jgi:hypothetical protein
LVIVYKIIFAANAALLIKKYVKFPKYLIHLFSNNISGMLKIWVMSVLFAWGAQQAFAQNAIIISDSLTANADVLPVTFANARRLTTAFMKFPKVSFGDYEVVSGKWSLPWAPTTTNLWGTKSVTKSSRKFSFILTCKANDSVKVNGVLKTFSQTKNSVQISKSISVGGYQQLGSSVIFSANIVVTGDSSHLWTLSIKIENGSDTAKNEAFLTDGKRNILITPVRTTQDALPDYGYEFAENDHFYSAYQLTGRSQYFRGTYKIYLEKILDPKMKLVLSGAMVAIFELKDSTY